MPPLSRSVLVCVLPARGHVAPAVAVVDELISAGHAVHVITGRRYRDQFVAAGASVTLLEACADFDDADLDASFPARRGLRGLRLARHDLIEAFVRPIPSRWATVQAVLAGFPADTVLVDPFFLAGIPLVLTRRAGGPRVFVLGITPVMLPPHAPPGRTAGIREPLTAWAMRRALAPVQSLAEQLVLESTGRPLPTWFTHWVGLTDGILQLTCPGFEYPRPRATTPIHFVGPTATSTARDHPLPPWWDDLEQEKPVIHVTQGTIANGDVSAVIEPSLAALADRECLVVVSTGGAPPPANLPSNARTARYLPYDALLPRCALMITNGGYGGVNHALRYGVPLVVVGASEDKRPVAQRVAWSGAGIGIGRAQVSAARIALATRQVLADPSYAAHARRLGAQMGRCPRILDILCG